jgi:hypothetical protein
VGNVKLWNPKGLRILSDKQGYVAVDQIRFRFHPLVGGSLLIDFPPASQHGSHGEGTEQQDSRVAHCPLKHLLRAKWFIL